MLLSSRCVILSLFSSVDCENAVDLLEVLISTRRGFISLESKCTLSKVSIQAMIFGIA